MNFVVDLVVAPMGSCMSFQVDSRFLAMWQAASRPVQSDTLIHAAHVEPWGVCRDLTPPEEVIGVSLIEVAPGSTATIELVEGKVCEVTSLDADLVAVVAGQARALNRNTTFRVSSMYAVTVGNDTPHVCKVLVLATNRTLDVYL